ncbi:MAG: hypothetical protein K2N34_01405 [Lachnospiraceae bacterium]|nr:hypothetical protein [Lachnospiraceae bacterium]
MSWDRQQKLAVLKSICFIVGADKKIMPQEMQLIQGFFNRYGLNMSAMNEQAAMSQFDMSLIISKMSDSDKRQIVSYWKQAMCCDGNIADEEIRVLFMMAEECEIDIADITI